MHTVVVKVEAKSAEGSGGDFDMEAAVTYRNVKTVEQVDLITKGVVDGLFALGKLTSGK